MRHSDFLEMVYGHVTANPESVPELIDTLTRAVRDRMSVEAGLRSDVEVALVMALSKRTKGNNDLLRQKLEAIQPYSSLNFESVIKDL